MVDYLRGIFRGTAVVVWVIATGLASILSFLAVAPAGVALGPRALAGLVFSVFCLLCITWAALVAGWSAHHDRTRLQVVSIHQLPDEPYGWQFLLTGTRTNAVGVVLDIRRRQGGTEVPFAIVEIYGLTAEGRYQARALHRSAAQRAAVVNGTVAARDLVVTSDLTRERLFELAMDRESGLILTR